MDAFLAVSTRNDWFIDNQIKNIVKNNPELLEQLDLEAISKLQLLCFEFIFGEDKNEIVRLAYKYGKKLNSLQIRLMEADIESVKMLLKNGEKPDGPEWYVKSLVRSLFVRGRDFKVQKNILLLLIKYGFNTGFRDSVNNYNLLHFLFHMSQRTVTVQLKLQTS